MTSIDIKNILIQKINEINDVSFLQAIKTIVESKAEKEVLMLTAEQKHAIIASQNEIDNGKFVGQSELDEKVAKWLNEE